MLNYISSISDDKFLSVICLLFLVVLTIMIGIIVAIAIIQHGKTKRTEILVQISSPKRKKEIAEKQLENEVSNNNDIDGKVIKFAKEVTKLQK